MSHFAHLFTLLFSISALAQDGVGIGTTSPHPSAALDINSANKGLLIPRTTSDPDTPADGLLTYDSNGNRFKFRENGNWSGTVPPGGIIMWSGSAGNIPSGWVLCDGNNTTPNLSGRFIVGYSGAGDYNTVRNTGGIDHLTLIASQMPSHSHGISTVAGHSHSVTIDAGGSHSHGITDPGHFHYIHSARNGGAGQISREHSNNGNNNRQTFGATTGITVNSGGSHSHSASTGMSPEHSHTNAITGGDGSFDNRPAYFVLAFIMKLP